MEFKMIFSLLEGEAAKPANGGDWWTYVILAVVAVAFIVLFIVLPSRKRKKQEKDAQDLINAVGPGNKVKTIGGICGIVVEVDNEESTFVLETGSETTGKCYIKFDRQAIYQTDAKVEEEKKPETETAPAAEPATENPEAAPVAEEPKVEEPAPEPVPAEEPAAEVAPETAPAAPKKKGGKKKSSDNN